MAKIKIEELASLPSFYLPRLSPDRKKIVYFGDQSGRMEIYIKDLASKETIQLTDGQAPRSIRAGFIWHPDSKHLVFPKDQDGDENHNLFLLDTETKEITPLTEYPAQHYPIDIDREGRFLSLTSNREGQLNLYILDLKSGELEKMTSFPRPVSGGYWALDGKSLFFSTNETEDTRNNDLYMVNKDDKKIQKFYSSGKGNNDQCRKVSPCGKLLGLDTEKEGLTQAAVLHLETGTIFYPKTGEAESHFMDFSPEGDKYLVRVNKNATLKLREYNLRTGKASNPEIPEGFTSWGEYKSEEEILTLFEDTINRPQLISLPGKEIIIPAAYNGYNPEDFAPGKLVSFPSSDGLEIEAILYLPKGEGPHPGIVMVHGGPTSQDFLSFNPFCQFLTSLGFAVLRPNYRGSTGYGKEFREKNLGDIGGKDAEDVAQGAKYLSGLPEIDSNKLICIGGSYGGYMTYWQLVTRPDLWTAGIAWIGITDWEKLFQSSAEHFKFYLEHLFRGLPEKTNLYRERSPIHYAPKLKAPLQIIHGVNDPRVPLEQAQIFRDKLLELGFKEGKDFFYEELSEEGHGTQDIQQKIRIFKLMEKFLNKV